MRDVALWEAAEKYNEKHISETKIHMKESTRREQTQSCKFDANFSTAPPQKPALFLCLHAEAVSVFGVRRIYLYGAVFSSSVLWRKSQRWL